MSLMSWIIFILFGLFSYILMGVFVYLLVKFIIEVVKRIIKMIEDGNDPDWM